MVWRKRWAGLGLFVFFSTMLPFASTAWNGVEEWVSWVYLYFPLVGLAFLIGGGADVLWRRKVRVLVPAIGALIVLCYGVQQVRLNVASRSAEPYWKRVVHLHPDSEIATLELGKAYLEQRETEQALRFLFSPARKQLHAPCLAMSRYSTREGDLLPAAIHLRMALHKEHGLQFQNYEMAEAELLCAAGAPDYAEAALGTVLMANPYNMAAMERLFEVWVLKGYVPAAGRLLERTSEIAPRAPEVVRMQTRWNALQTTSADTLHLVHPPEPSWLRYTMEGSSDARLRKEIVRASERYLSDPVIQMEAVLCLVQAGQYDRALSKITSATQSLSSCAYAWAMRCWAETEAGAYEQAEKSGRRALTLDPRSPTAHSVLGILFGKIAGEAQEGSPTHPRGLARAIRHYQQALQLDPRHAATHNNLGNLLVKQGKFDEAIAHYREAIRIRPALAETHYNLGNLFVRQGKLDEAVEHYQQALRCRRDYAKAHNNLGTVLTRLNRLDEAIVHFQHALRIQPDYAEAHNNLGITFFQQGKSEEAVVHFQQALNIQPDYAEAHYNLGNLRTEQGRLDEAIEHYHQALRIQPDYAKVLYNLGIALARQDRPEEARASFQRAVRLNPNYVQAHNRWAMALMGQRRFDESIRILREGLVLAPDHFGVAINLAWLLATCPEPHLRNGTEAVRLAERVCRATEAPHPRALDTLAAAYAEMGRFDEAIEQATQALQRAVSSGQTRLSKQIEARLTLYKAHRRIYEP